MLTVYPRLFPACASSRAAESHRLCGFVPRPRFTDPGQNGHTPKRPHPKRPQLFWLPKRPQPKRPHCIGQNGHTGRITTKTAKLHSVKTATQGGSLPKRPHCIWSKRPQREDHYKNGHTAFGQNFVATRCISVGHCDHCDKLKHNQWSQCSHQDYLSISVIHWSCRSSRGVRTSRKEA